MKCPKCGVAIKRFDLSPNCKNCGVHIMYYTQEEDLALDAKKTELEFAKARVFVAGLKAAFIKGKLAVARMVFIVLTALCLLIPFATLTLDLPYFQKEISLSALGIYNLFSNGLLEYIFEFPSMGVAANVFALFLVTAFSYLLTVLSGVLIFVVWLLSFINLKKSTKLLVRLSGVAVVFDVLTLFLALTSSVAAKGYTAIGVNIGAGSFVALAVFIIFGLLNFKMQKENISPHIKEVDLQRLEVAKKVKAGEISLADLPLPIFETEEELSARKNALASSKAKNKKGGAENE